MKKTIWIPLALGSALGLLASIATITGLSLVVPGTSGTENVIGFWMTLLLLAAALGGPLAGVIASSLFITLANFFGSLDMRAIINDPVVYWTNLLVVGILAALVGFAYRLIFGRVKMPVRLLFWAGIVITVYIIIAPANLILQYYFHNEIDVLPAILGLYRVYMPQAIFDIFFTSLVFIALPMAYTRPLWYEPKQMPLENGKIQDRMEKGVLSK